ncbi:MAG: flagellar biosynthetic protein FliR [Bacteroidales bacterium]
MDSPFLFWLLKQFDSFLLILMRVLFIIFMMPIFGSRNLPILLKIGLSLMISFILLPVVKIKSSQLFSGVLSLSIYLIGEAMIGFILGYSIKLVFTGIQLAGGLIGTHMGFSIANILDPQLESDSTVIGQFYYFLAVTIFFVIDGHHWFLRAMIDSFQLLPPGELYLSEGLYKQIIITSGKIFQIAIKIVAPIMAILIFVQLALGIIARLIPQINLLISSFPITIGLGLIFLGLSIDPIFSFIKGILGESGRGLVHVLLPLMRR